MSGHSKFANIKHKKEKNGVAKGKIFTIIGREAQIRRTTADCVTSLPRQRQTICQMILSTVVLRKQPVMLTL